VDGRTNPLLVELRLCRSELRLLLSQFDWEDGETACPAGCADQVELMRRRPPEATERMTPLDVLEVRRHQRAEHPNRLAMLASELGFPTVAAMLARADAIYADPAQGRQPTPLREVADADVADDVYLARLRER
jgi:hypothetical protein